MLKKHDVCAVVLGIWAAVVLWLTVLGREVQFSSIKIKPPLESLLSVWKEIQTTGIRGNFFGNVLLFVPFGILFPTICVQRKGISAILAAGVFSILIEIMQLFSRRGCFDLDDVILNIAGAAFGYLLSIYAERYVNKNRPV